jgi:sporulation protein YlmC with PRC-barrel domain
MKSTLIGCLTAVTLGIGAASAAQPSNDKTPATTESAAPAAAMKTPDAMKTPAAAMQTPDAMKTPAAAMSAGDSFITMQEPGTLRAPKLVGVAVYDSQDKDVGKIADLLLDKDGSVKAVVIGIGGFLGIGTKDVAVPYSEVHWKTAPRKVEVGQPGAGAAANVAPGAGVKPVVKTIPTADTVAYQGYPDKAMLDMSQAQLKAAPEFHYVKNPSEMVRAEAIKGTAPATKP